MKIVEEDSAIEVTINGLKIRYGQEWMDKKGYLHSKGSEKIAEWKIDLIENYGVKLDELQSKD